MPNGGRQCVACQCICLRDLEDLFFGPVQAWWTFPFEQLMLQVIKTYSNNQIGWSLLVLVCFQINADKIPLQRKLETTLLTAFSCSANLRALLETKELPSSPLLIAREQTPSRHHQHPPRLFLRRPALSDEELQLLVDEIKLIADSLTGLQRDFQVNFISMLKEADKGVKGGDEFREGLRAMMVWEDEGSLEIDGNQGVKELRWPPDQSIDGHCKVQKYQ
ncbi:uncharacterized protein VP01_2920g2 [Puccinia sorghi]|uniref:Uncharacterized protein n=1 Tax=Puccinia sorghi TaxID=27349 RepID=A0A0L6V221_9BASI|nr:uncharacterized protein VP01_2920g2 [Puccinia sorghi]